MKNGSEKQIAWAEKIKKSELAQLDNNIREAQAKRDYAAELNQKDGEMEARNVNIQHQNERIAFYRYMQEILGKMDDAQKWINEAQGIAEKAYHSNNGIRNGQIVKLV